MMMNGSGAMMGGMMILWILVAVLLVLGIAALAKYLLTKRRSRKLEHDPEKWEPVFRKDHAQ
ncbi:MAG: hypothetical protein L0I29_04925, partial [Hyphomicrobiales bacterium]|nr:hypothetical protein [Hyphomicrobiales bacterium]